eukprot:104321-Pleurochrysis_carterae.AAC.1
MAHVERLSERSRYLFSFNIATRLRAMLHFDKLNCRFVSAIQSVYIDLETVCSSLCTPIANCTQNDWTFGSV